MVPRENKNNAKFAGDKQRVLWYFPKWPIWVGFETSPNIRQQNLTIRLSGVLRMSAAGV